MCGIETINHAIWQFKSIKKKLNDPKSVKETAMCTSNSIGFYAINRGDWLTFYAVDLKDTRGRLICERNGMIRQSSMNKEQVERFKTAFEECKDYLNKTTVIDAYNNSADGYDDGFNKFYRERG